MYLATAVKDGNLILINILHNEADKANFEKEIKEVWDKYFAQNSIRSALMLKISEDIEEELKNTVDLPKIPLIKNDGLSDKYAEAFRSGRLNEAEVIMQQIREIANNNHEIRKRNRNIDKMNYEARKNKTKARSSVLARLSDEERAMYNAHLSAPYNPSNVEIVEIDINNFAPVNLRTDIYQY